MIKNMLQAASKMLDYKGSDAATDFKARVGCAKIIIDEIVAGMEPRALEEIIASDDIPLKVKPAPKKQNSKYAEPEVGVKDGKLVTIKNVPLDGLVEITAVNGLVTKMTHEEAIGKPFKDIKILWRPND